jgi:hypothetical protein
MGSIGADIDQLDRGRPAYNAYLEGARKRLGDARWRSLLDEGSTLDSDEAADLALHVAPVLQAESAPRRG